MQSVSPVPEGKVCGAYINQVLGTWPIGPVLPTVEWCALACKLTAGCTAFAWASDPSQGYCFYHFGTLATSDFVVVPPDQAQGFVYDLSCWDVGEFVADGSCSVNNTPANAVPVIDA